MCPHFWVESVEQASREQTAKLPGIPHRIVESLEKEASHSWEWEAVGWVEVWEVGSRGSGGLIDKCSPPVRQTGL